MSQEKPHWLSSFRSKLHKTSEFVDKGIAQGFRRWSRIVSHRPYVVIAVSTLFALVWGMAFYSQLEVELDSEDLFTPDDAQSFDDKAYVDSVYGTISERARIVVLKKPVFDERGKKCGRLLLSDEKTARESIQEFFSFYREVEQLEISYGGRVYRLDDICVKPSEKAPCLVTSILDLWDYDSTIIMASDFNPLEKINAGNLTDRFGRSLPEVHYLGKSETIDCDSETDLSANIEAFGMTIIYQYEREEINGEEIDPESLKWVRELADRVRELSKDDALDFYLSDPNALVEETNELVLDESRFLIGGYLLILAFTSIVLYKNSCLACKAHLTPFSLIGILFALLSAFGIAQTMNLKFNSLVLLLPFLILGLGIDDTYVIVGAYQRVDHALSVHEKIAQTMERAGSSIFVTSATDCVAFLFGIFTKIPGIRVFSAYAAIAIFFDFAFQVTFFTSFLVLEARREERYRNGASRYGWECCCGLTQDHPNNVPMSPPSAQEMTQATHRKGESTIPMTQSEQTPVPNLNLWRKMCFKGDYDPQKPSVSTKLVGTVIPSVTLHPIGRIVFIVIECLLLGAAIYGCTRVEMDFNYVDRIARQDSPIRKAYKLEEQYFVGDQIFFGVYTKEAESDYFYHQDELAALRTALEEDPFVVSPVMTWYQGYSDWLLTKSPYGQQLVNGSAPTAELFNRWLREYLDGAGAVFNGSVLFSEGNNSRIISSKIDATTVDLLDGQQAVDIIDSLRRSIETAAPSLDPIPYALPFIFFDGFGVIATETTRNVILAGVAVFVINCVVLASLRMALIVVGMVALTDVMLFAFIWYSGHALNPVTAINMVLAVGLAVDYSAHIAHSFLVISGDRLSRAKGALEHIGGEVLAGAFSTWLGIVFLVFAQFYAYQVFFVMTFAMIVLGAWHGLIILPIVLSFIGSDPYLSRKAETSDDVAAVP